jgi:guanosine-3',5'-bis(diphosphate) 3'-pyrophosphohydrolase
MQIMNRGEIVEKVKMFADQAHGEQMRKYSNERYIVHPIRVMELVREYSQAVPLLSAALLHDVLEDTDVTEDALKEFLIGVMDEETASKTFGLVKELTDVYIKTNFPKLNRRTRRTLEAERLGETTSDAQTIKYADVIDNVKDIVGQDTDFALVYIRESKHLLSYLNKGDLKLRKRAVDVVDHALKQYFENANIKAL